MSFRLFIYYCAGCGACAAFGGWALGRLLAPESGLGRALVQGLMLGMVVSLGVASVDALGNYSIRRVAEIGKRVGIAVVVGCVGGLIGALLGHWLVSMLAKFRSGGPALAVIEAVFRVVGWTITGLAIGASIAAFDFLAGLARRQNTAGARRKMVHGLLGGGLGGLVGGTLHLALGSGLDRLFGEGKDLLSPSALGFVALGLSIGLLIGLAQVILREAWVRVEAGFRAGRELILSKPETTIGRSESSDIGLFGDPGVDRTHALIRLQGHRYLVADAGGPGGTFVNDQRVGEPVPLHSGDVIRLGESRLRFGERQKRARRL